MSNDDRAICIGISDYVDKKLNLNGAREDAIRFRDWLMRADGGGLAKDEQCKLILTPRPAEGTPSPRDSQIIDALHELRRIAQANEDAGGRYHVGRRLWVYVSGHGYSIQRETVLLVADAEPRAGVFNHFAARCWIDWFRAAGVFDELVLLMDCCRISEPSLSVTPPNWGGRKDGRPGKQLYCYAAVDGAIATETTVRGSSGGVFTNALLAILEDPANRPLRASALSNLLYRDLTGSSRPFVDLPRDPEQDFEILPPPTERAPPRTLVLHDRSEPSKLIEAALRSNVVVAPIEDAAAHARGVDSLVIAADTLDMAQMTELASRVKAGRVLVYSHNAAPVGFGHVPAKESDDPALAWARVRAAMEDSATFTLRVTTPDLPLARVDVWSPNGERLQNDSGLYEGLPEGTYRVRASLGASSQTVDRALSGYVHLRLDPIVLDTAAPLADSPRWTAVDREALSRVPVSGGLVIVFRGADELVLPDATTTRVGGWIVAAIEANTPQVIKLPLFDRSVSLAVPVTATTRTEIYVDTAADRPVDLSIRVVPRNLPLGAAVPTDRIRESLRLRMIGGEPMPWLPIGTSDVQGDPIAALLAIGSVEDVAVYTSWLPQVASVLGEDNPDVSVLRGNRTTLALPPLLARSWSHHVRHDGDVVKDAPADQIAGRQLYLDPWLVWDNDKGAGRQTWLRAVAGAAWPCWETAPDTARIVTTASEIARQLNVPIESARRRNYKSPPIEWLRAHQRVAFVGASNDQLAAALAVAFVERDRKQWSELVVWTLSDGALGQVRSGDRTGASLRRSRDRANAELRNLLPVVAQQWNVREYDGLHFGAPADWYFASLWDWDRAGGIVHLSKYEPGTDVRTSSFNNYFWTDSAPPREYADGVTAYEALASTAR